VATPKKKAPPKRLSKTVEVEAAAKLLGIEVPTLMRKRERGLPPGNLGYKNAKNVLVWDRAAVTKKRSQ
jgi:hypothetical protein